jgi:hypothetical protein
MSHTDIVRQGKRLSLQFPIQPAAGSNSPAFSPRARPQSWIAAPSPIPSPESTPSSPAASILAVLAAQERYVLELREELGKAEEDLKTLKKHYAQHEATKRRNDGRKIAQLQPLNTSLANSPADDTDEEGPNIMQREMERRKALLNITRSSQRKVFSGSRHLRTLSLLSPDRSHAPAFPQPLDLLSDEPQSQARPRRPSPPARALTSDTSRQLIDVANSDRYDAAPMPNMQRENIIRAGKQMATDFSNGLFTFIEDIRQATVGDEAVNGAGDGSGPSHNRGPSSKSPRNVSGSRPPLNRSASSKKQSQGTGSIGEDFWSEHGLSEPTSTPVNKKTHNIKPAHTPQNQSQGGETDFEDDWDWDTPNLPFVAKTTDSRDDSDESDAPASPVIDGDRTITSASYHASAKRHDSKNSSVATISSSSMPDKSGSRDPKRNSLPWSDLTGLSPSNLKRTASHLMKEWEKQLTPPPESRLSSHTHGDFIGRTGSPSGLS